MNTRRALSAALVLLITALACVLPGIQTASPFGDDANLTPTADTRLDIMIAETVSSALELTALAVPTVTPTLLPTLPPPTVTPTPQPVSSGSTLTKQDDGSTIFVDENAGYKIAVPANWLAVRINEKEYYDAWLLPQAVDSHIQASLMSIQDQDPTTFRLLALDVQEGHIKNEIVTNMTFILDQGTAISFDTEGDLTAFADNLPSTMEGLTVSSVEIVIPPSGVPYGVIKSEVGGFNASGAQVSLYQKMALFNLKTGTLVITFTTENGFAETTLPVFDGMLATIAVDIE